MTPLLACVCQKSYSTPGIVRIRRRQRHKHLRSCAGARGSRGCSSSSPGAGSLRTGHGPCPEPHLQLRGCVPGAGGCFSGREAGLWRRLWPGGLGAPLDGSAGPAERPRPARGLLGPGGFCGTSGLLSGHSCRQRCTCYSPSY